jgi:presenilin-like A22 family membrane protease
MGEEKPETEGFRPRLGHLLPVVLSLGITGILGYPLLSSSFTPTPIVVFQGGTPADASLNALYFVVALGVTATAMLFLVRRGQIGVLKKLVKVAVVVVCFTVALWYTSTVYSLSGLALDATSAPLLLLALSLGAAVALGFFVFGKGKRRQLVGVVLLSALTGVFLGSNIDLLTALVLAGALVVYDIVAVFRGPVGALARSIEPGDLPGAMFNYQELSIGMGDMVFYSLLAMTALLFGGPASFFGAGVGIVAGTFLGFKALQRFEMFPGLPFSLVLGIVGMFLGRLAGVLLFGGSF